MFDQEQWEQLLVSFLEEAKELIQNAETALLALDEQAADEDTINGLFRAMHTLKGSAGLFSRQLRTFRASDGKPDHAGTGR